MNSSSNLYVDLDVDAASVVMRKQSNLFDCFLLTVLQIKRMITIKFEEYSKNRTARTGKDLLSELKLI